MRNLLLLVLVFSISTAVNQSAVARGRRPTKASPSPAANQSVISAVAANSVTIQDAATTKTLIVSPVSEITVNGQKATIADLKVGMTVSVVLSDPTHASRIAATGGSPPAAR